MTDEETEIQRIMSERGCSRSEATRRYNALVVTMGSLCPQPKPQPTQPQPIEETEPKTDQKDVLTQRKLKVLDRLEGLIDDAYEENQRDEEIQAQIKKQLDAQEKRSLEDQEWLKILHNQYLNAFFVKYLFAIQFIAKGYCDKFVVTFTRDGDKVSTNFDFFDKGQQVLFENFIDFVNKKRPKGLEQQ